jgi:hypothetical protein
MWVVMVWARSQDLTVSDKIENITSLLGSLLPLVSNTAAVVLLNKEMLMESYLNYD